MEKKSLGFLRNFSFIFVSWRVPVFDGLKRMKGFSMFFAFIKGHWKSERNHWKPYVRFLEFTTNLSCEKKYFPYFSCMFLNPNIFFPIWILIFLSIRYQKPPGISWKSILWPQIVLTFYCLIKLFQWSQNLWAFSLKFQKFTRTIFSHSRSEQFW